MAQEVEMVPDDIVIYCDGNYYHVSEKENKYIGKFGDIRDAEKAILKWMENNKYWPAVWFISDHGNIDLYRISIVDNRRSKFMQTVANILKMDITRNYFFDKRANGRYRIKIVGKKKDFPEDVQQQIRELPHVEKVGYVVSTHKFNLFRGDYSGLSITIDCKLKDAM